VAAAEGISAAVAYSLIVGNGQAAFRKQLAMLPFSKRIKGSSARRLGR
jgi:hypothetical protein